MTRSGHGSIKRGYTLVELLIATTLTLVMMGGVATVFGMIGSSIAAARAGLEMADALRSTAERLRADLEGVTATISPAKKWIGGLAPLALSDGRSAGDAESGYFEYLEGPLGPVTPVSSYAVNSDAGGSDSTVDDTDDILMFTTKSPVDAPFVGRYAGNPVESQEAEVAWFMRGRTLYRRSLLVTPNVVLSAEPPSGFYNRNDVSARLDRDTSGTLSLAPNSLVDLARRECRYAHHYRAAVPANDDVYPFSAARWGQLGLPTLAECSHPNWTIDGMNPVAILSSVTFPSPNVLDFWANFPLAAWGGVDTETGALSAYYNPADPRRLGEDVILSNVIGFDVKAWDPWAPIRSDGTVVLLPGDLSYPGGAGYNDIAYGAYVDLGYYPADPGLSLFSGIGSIPAMPRVFDTWSLSYEHDGIDQDVDGGADEAWNAAFAGDDDESAREAAPPYPPTTRLRGIQIRIRVFEPDSRQIREVTIVHSFAR